MRGGRPVEIEITLIWSEVGCRNLRGTIADFHTADRAIQERRILSFLPLTFPNTKNELLYGTSYLK